MFNPNPIPSFSHRSKKFHTLYKNIVDLFRAKFTIPEDFEIIILNCSGRIANEIVISSYIGEWQIQKSIGRFQSLLMQYASRYSKLDDNGMGFASVLWETSLCCLNESCKDKKEVIFLDCISAFPFYNPFKLNMPCDVMTTCSSKQIGSQPVLSVIVIKKSILLKFDNNKLTNLNLQMYHSFAENHETPGTSSIYLFQDFYKRLLQFNYEEFSQKILNRIERFNDLFNKNEICKRIGLVTKLDGEKISKKLFQKYKFYIYQNDPLIFLWSENDKKFDSLIKDLGVL